MPRRDRRARVSLQLLVAFTFAAIISLIIGGLLWFNHRSMSGLAHQEAHMRFSDLSRQIREEARDQLATAHVFLTTVTQTTNPFLSPDEMGKLQVQLLRTLQETAPAVLGVIAGWPNGALVMSQRYIPQAGSLAPSGTAYEIVMSAPDSAMAGGFARRQIFLDVLGEEIGRAGPTATAYDVRHRPWYQKAITSDHAVTVQPYRFAHVPEIGLTVAQRSAIDERVAFGIDVLMSDLDDALARMKTAPEQELALFTSGGELAAHPRGRSFREAGVATGENGLPLMSAVNSPLLSAIYASYKADSHPGDRTLTVDDTEYLVRFEPGLAGTGMVTAIAIPRSAILGPANDLARRLLAMGVLALFVALPVVALAARSITRPLHGLTGAVGKIVSFQSGGAEQQPSRITEIQELSTAVSGLELAMKNFMRYVPGQIVRNIVMERIQPSLGGVRQQTTLVFTDIANFTGIAERLPPETLTDMISRYFGVVGGALIESGGTIDKYIGDGVMAFWNAPELQDDHIARACHGVLNAMERLTRLNAEFLAEGLPELRTRVGLHTGEAVIGNVGSFDRINYTVLGHTVNLAARLEALNKEYGTAILVTQAVRDGAGDAFRFREVGAVTVRGASEPVLVYELLGLQPDASEARPASEAADATTRLT